MLREQEIYNKVVNRQITKAEAMKLLKSMYTQEKVAAAPKDPGSRNAGIAVNEEKIKEKIGQILSGFLHLSTGELKFESSFKDMGIDSINGVEIIRDINSAFGLNLDTVTLYDYSTVNALSAHILKELGGRESVYAAGSIGEDHSSGKQESEVSESVYETMEDETDSEAEDPGLQYEVCSGADLLAGLAGIIGEILHEPAERIDSQSSFKDMGIDSINGVEIVRAINSAYRLNLDTIALYDYPNINALAKQIQSQTEKVSKLLNSVNTGIKSLKPSAVKEREKPVNMQLKPVEELRSYEKQAEAATGKISLKKYGKQNEETIQNEKLTRNDKVVLADMAVQPAKPEKAKDTLQEKVAIIGISCRLPGASNAEEYWSNIANGMDSVTKIPEERWDVDKYYDADTSAPNKTYSKHGGFISAVDRFDPLFFNISPMEAELMDPQQRLLLEETWKAVEDAGYSDRQLSGMKCGVFIGATHSDYRKLLEKAGQDNTAYAFTGLNTFILSGRISYVLNLNGPNMAIDTACSSSLVAINQACQSILHNECEMAIAGGIRLMMTPDLHIQTSKIELLSKTAKCRPFDRDADGLVLSEGVSVLVLKAYSRAIKDKDHIYGVIIGSGVNQDGKSNGITAPSAQAQTNLELDVYRKYGINPGSISMIEANGTGTKLGDAIEIKALKETFSQYTEEMQFCAIGSVKANIGHTTMASGAAGVIKVLMAMKHGKIPPMLNYNNENEQIGLKNSPFYVNRELTDWNPRNSRMRRAAVSSFGLSGTNCHLVIEEASEQMREINPARHPYYFIPVSAKTENALKQKFKDLYLWLEGEGKSQSIGDIAYTLSMGRSHFAVRGALIAKNRESLLKSVKEICETGSAENYVTNNIKEKQAKTISLMKEFGKTLLLELHKAQEMGEMQYADKLMALAELYVNGYELEWQTLYGEDGYKRISMPAYPFLGERFWVNGKNDCEAASKASAAKLRPLIGSNTSTLNVQRFTTRFDGEEFYLADHMFDGKKVLPGVAYLDMALAAGELAGEKRVKKLGNIMWANPFIVDTNPAHANISLYPGNDSVEFEITGEDGNLCSQGSITFEEDAAKVSDGQVFDIEAIKARCNLSMSGTMLYSRFGNSREGLYLGKSLRSVQEIWKAENEALSRLTLPHDLKRDFEAYGLHPSLVDGIVETVITLMLDEKSADGCMFMPFALAELELYSRLPEQCYAYAAIRPESRGNAMGVKKFDMLLLSDDGRILAKFTDFSVREVKKKENGEQPCTDSKVLDLLGKLGQGKLDAGLAERLIGVIMNEQ